MAFLCVFLDNQHPNSTYEAGRFHANKSSFVHCLIRHYFGQNMIRSSYIIETFSTIIGTLSHGANFVRSRFLYQTRSKFCFGLSTLQTTRRQLCSTNRCTFYPSIVYLWTLLNLFVCVHMIETSNVRSDKINY